jgi:capsular exopolysaccharide synthesis family protein
MLGIGLAFIMEYLDDSWRSPDEVERISGVPAFGVIPKSGATMFGLHRGAGSVASREGEKRNGFPGGLAAAQEPAGVDSEAYRILCTKLFYSLLDSPSKVIVLTSAGRHEGRTTTVANLGVALAQADKNVLILDCDLRNPALHKRFGSKNIRGLVNILVDGQHPQEVWQEPIPRLKMISAGPLPPNPMELLSSRRLTAFLEEMRQEFDYVLVDTPPVGLSDSFVLAANGDGVLLIVHTQRTRKGALPQAVRDLQSVGANVLGTVMNSYGAPKDDYYSNLRYKR